MRWLQYLIKPYGYTRLARRLKIPKRTLSAYGRGIQRPSAPHLRQFRNVYRSIQQQRMKSAGFSSKLARSFRDMSLTHISRRVDLMDGYVERLAQRHILQKRVLPHDIAAYKQNLKRQIRIDMRESERTWKSIQGTPKLQL